MGNIAFEVIGDEEAKWLDRNFEEEEVRQAVFDLAGDKAPGLHGFSIAFFQHFWVMLKKDILKFMKEFHWRGMLSKGIGASFIALVLKKSGEIGIKDYRPISLLGSIYKILAKVLPGRIQKDFPNIISSKQGAFIKGR